MLIPIFLAVINGKGENCDIMSYYVIMWFDKLDYFETHNDLWDTQVNNDKFALIAKLDSQSCVIIKTPAGETRQLTFAELIMPGSVFAGIKCCITIDSFSRECLSSEESVAVYTYKGCVDVPPVSFVDDILTVSKCGVETVETNSFINAKIE